MVSFCPASKGTENDVGVGISFGGFSASLNEECLSCRALRGVASAAFSLLRVNSRVAQGEAANMEKVCDETIFQRVGALNELFRSGACFLSTVTVFHMRTYHPCFQTIRKQITIVCELSICRSF